MGLKAPPGPPQVFKCFEYSADGVVALTASGRVGGPKSLHSRFNITVGLEHGEGCFL